MSRTDGLGQVYSLTGLQAYVSCNCTRDLFGQAGITDAPTVAVIPNIVVASSAAQVTDGALSLLFDLSGSDDGIAVIANMSAPRSAGRSFESDQRFLEATAPGDLTNVDYSASYTAKYGVPPVGSRLFYRLVPVSADYSFQGVAVVGSKVVVSGV